MSTSPFNRRQEDRRARSGPRGTLRACWSIGLFAALALSSNPAAAQKARITNISDVSFGLISNLQSDARQSQNICVFSNGTTSGYSILATGSGTGSSFSLSSGASSLAYEVQWSPQSGQSSGTPLTSGVALTGQTSSATHQSCNTGPATSASLTIILRASELSKAREGSYTGSLTLLVAAE